MGIGALVNLGLKKSDEIAKTIYGALPNSIVGYHASPNKIISQLKLGDDIGIHFANNPSLAENAAVKSAFSRRGDPYAKVTPYKFLINVNPEEVLDIKGQPNRFDYYAILEDLLENKKINNKTFNEMYNKLLNYDNKINENPYSNTNYEKLKNNYFSKTLKKETGARVLKYFNKFDAGPTWKDIEEGKLYSDVKPDFSYIVLDSDVIKPMSDDSMGQLKLNPIKRNDALSESTQDVINSLYFSPDHLRNVLDKDKDYARDYLTELLSGSLTPDRHGRFAESLTKDPVPEELFNNVKKELYNQTQAFLDLNKYSDVVDVYRIGDISKGEIQSFTLNPRFSGESLPWAKDKTLKKYKVNKKNILGSTDINKPWSEQEILINSDSLRS
jgi:hypothetical protein